MSQILFSRRSLLAGVAATAALPTAVYAGATRPLLVAATNQRMPTGFLALDAGQLAFKSRTLHIVGAPATQLVLGFCGWAVPSNIEIDLTTPYSYTKVAIEFGGRTVPVTFRGKRGVTVAGGQPYVLSDPIRATAFGLKAFVRDTQFFVRAAGTAAGTDNALPFGTVAVGFGMNMATFAAADAIDDIDAGGALLLPAGAVRHYNAPGPNLVLGRFPPRNLAVICAGDSIADGAGDAAQIATGHGFFNRAAVDANGLNAVPSLNLTKFGSTSGTTVAGLGVPGAPGYAYRQALLRFGNVLVDEFGTNTLGNTAVIKPSRVLDTSRGLWTVARAAGVQRIVRTTLLPGSASNNRFVDAAGQEPRLNWGPGEARDEINTGFAAALAAHEIDAVADTLAAVADPGDSHRWMTNGTPFYPSNDGVHPSAAMSRLMATELRAAYGRIAVR